MDTGGLDVVGCPAKGGLAAKWRMRGVAGLWHLSMTGLGMEANVVGESQPARRWGVGERWP